MEYNVRVHCRLCKARPRKSALITFCSECKKKVDNVRNSYKINKKEADFNEAYNGSDDMLRRLVEDCEEQTKRPDGLVGSGRPRAKWGMARYEEKRETTAESKDGFMMEFMDEADFIEWWTRKMKVTKAEAKTEWDCRVASADSVLEKDPETKLLTLGLWKRYRDVNSSIKNSNSAVVGLRESKAPKDGKIDALQFNVTSRLSFEGVVDQHDRSAQQLLKEKNLTQYCKDAELKLVPDKRPKGAKHPLAGQESGVNLEAEQQAMQFELKVSECRGIAVQHIEEHVKQATAVFKDIIKVFKAVDNAVLEDPESHKREFYAELVNTVTRRRDSLWLALGYPLPAPVSPEGLERLPRAASVAASETALQEYIEGLTATGEALPCAGFAHLCSAPKLAMLAGRLARGAENDEELAEANSHFSLQLERFKLLTTHVSKAFQRLQGTLAARQKKAVADKSKEDAAARAAAKAQAKAHEKKAQGFTKHILPKRGRMCTESVFDLNLESVGKKMLSIACSSGVPCAEGLDLDSPIHFTSIPWLIAKPDGVSSLQAEDLDMRTTGNLWKGGFPRSSPCKQRGRAHGEIPAAPSTFAPARELVGSQSLFEMDLGPKYNAAIVKMHFFGYSPTMVNCGPESNMIDALRLTFEGKRLVVAFSAKDMMEYAVANLPSDMVSVKDRCDACLSRLDAGTFAKVCQEGAGIFYAHASPGSALWVPGGFVVAEQCVGDGFSYGIRLSPLRKKITVGGHSMVGMQALLAACQEDEKPESSAMASFLKLVISRTASDADTGVVAEGGSSESTGLEAVDADQQLTLAMKIEKALAAGDVKQEEDEQEAEPNAQPPLQKKPRKDVPTGTGSFAESGRAASAASNESAVGAAAGADPGAQADADADAAVSQNADADA